MASRSISRPPKRWPLLPQPRRRKRNWDAFCISIVGPSGDLVYFEKLDNCQFASVTISQHKARTAARYRRPTLVFETLIGKGPSFGYLTTLDDVIASRGGNPLNTSVVRSSVPSE